MALKRILALALVIALAFLSAVSFTSCKKEESYTEGNEKIKVGMSGPLTGENAMYGIAVKNSAQLAIDEINESGGIGGVMLELYVVDDKHDASLVSKKYTELYTSGCQLFLGTVTTKPGIKFKELATRDGIFYLTPSASGDEIPSAKGGFQMCFTDKNQGTASADLFNKDYSGKKIGIFYKVDDDYSVGIKNNFVANLDSSFEKPIESSYAGDTTDFSVQISRLKDCDVIFMPIYYTPAAEFMKQGDGIVKNDAVYFGCDGFDGIDALDSFEIEKIPQEVSFISHFDINATEGAPAEYVKAYVQAFGDAPLNQFGASAYDCVYAMAKALEKSGKQISPTMSAKEISKILLAQFKGGFTFSGITGRGGESISQITWNPDGTVNKEAIKYVIKEAN